MIRKIKFGKIAIVIFLTILIWVWTDLDLDEELPVPRAMITVAYSAELLVSFNGQPEALINNIKLKGPAKKITDVRRELDNGSLELDFTLSPELEKMTATGSHTLNVLDFLKKSVKKIKELDGLTVEDCKPDIINVNIVELEKRPLDIECFGENGVPVKVESIVPDKVEMYVPKDSRLKAQVLLTSRDITQARASLAVKTPYVELAPGRTRPASTSVKIKMSPEADSLTEYQILGASFGTTLGLNLLGEYDVEVTNYNDLVSFSIFATAAAKEAYENQPYQIILYILDKDRKKGPDQEQYRDVVHNFPEEYVRNDEIRLTKPPQQAKFKLILISPAKSPPAGGN